MISVLSQKDATALDEFIIDGVTTLIPFHQKVLKHPSFIKGDFDTHFVDNYLKKQGYPLFFFFFQKIISCSIFPFIPSAIIHFF